MADNDRPTCKGITANGEPCRSHIVGDDGYCDAHRPGIGSDIMRSRGKKGGYATQARARHMEGISPDELPPLNSHEACQVWVEIIGRGVACGRIDPATANAARGAVDSWLRAHAGDLEGKIDQVEAKLSKLEDRLNGRR